MKVNVKGHEKSFLEFFEPQDRSCHKNDSYERERPVKKEQFALLFALIGLHRSYRSLSVNLRRKCLKMTMPYQSL